MRGVCRRFITGLRRKNPNQAIAIVDQGLVSGMNFLTSLILVRMLGIRQFGIFALAWAAVQFVYSLQLALLIAPLLSRGAKQTGEEQSEYLGATTLQQFAFGTVGSICLYAAAHWAPSSLVGSEGARLGGVLALTAFCYCVQDFARRLLFLIQRPWVALLSDVLSYAGQVTLLVGAAALGWLTITSAFLIVAVTSLLGACALLLVWRVRFVMTAPVQMKHLRGNFHFSKWLFASSLLQWSGTNMFLIAIATFLGPASVGMLRLGQSLMGVLHIWFQGMENFVPADAALLAFRVGTEAMHAYLMRIAATWGGPISLYLLLVAVFPAQLVSLVYGKTIPHENDVLRGYVLIYALMFINTLLRVELRSREDTRAIFLSNVVSTAISLLLAFPLARNWGLLGVIGGLAIQHVLAMLILSMNTARAARQRTVCASSTY